MADLGEQEFNDEAVQKVVKFMSDGCGCALGAKGGPCSKQFSNDTVLFNLNNCLELSSGELDLVILPSIQAVIPVPRQERTHLHKISRATPKDCPKIHFLNQLLKTFAHFC